ncbi:sensor histidine kinase [Actinocrinis puniceicyclus]|uniref:histidine kinase n=1 Tax=Actinocrinis puniceicyclus TaxID=977794 RepID=A0A8J7WGM0_9ACTN|nr:sensor histidine kinase [Actinocrinis puniceicyclus]MBS2961906.1 sensor histidine kinase [Actinocrinis puniceicyclus]
MLTVTVWILRTAGLVFVGVMTLHSPSAQRGALPTQAVAYALVCVGTAVWGLITWRPAAAARLGDRALFAALALTAAAAALGATAGGSGYYVIAFAVVAQLSAASDLSLSTALTVYAGAVLATEVGAVVFNQGIGTYLGNPMLIAIGLLFGRNRAAYRIQAEQSALLLAQHEQLRTEQRRADVLDERARIAREIHDVLAHSLGALSIQIQAARALLTDHDDVERALETLATAQRMASDGLVETRRAVHALRSDTPPLHEELARTGEQHATRYRVATRVTTEGTPAALPPDATIALLRTAQEALVNAAKHAPGQAVDVRLDFEERHVRLTVANALIDGAQEPADTLAPRTVDGGYGLTGMRERLRLLRGTLEAGPREDRWIVTADLPLDERATTQKAAR